MDETMLTFQKFTNEDVAKELIKKLEANNIAYEVEDTYQYVDPILAMNSVREIRIKLKPQDFGVAQKELEAYYKNLVDDVDDDYYLLAFTNQELTEIVLKPDEWGDFDYQLAQKLLKDRGIEIKPEVAHLIQQQRNDDLTTPETSNRFLLYTGYISAVLGGFFGILVGYHLAYNKKTLPDGRSLYRYTEKERNHGTRMLLLGAASCVFWVFVRYQYYY